MSESNKPPIWYWIAAFVALIWNGMGILNYLDQAYMTAEKLAELPAEQQVMYSDNPAWVTGAFAIAVFAGTIGSILLLLRKKLAYMIFVVSLLGIIAQWTHGLFIAENEFMLDGGQIAITIMVPLFAFLLVWLSKSAKSKGWIS